MAWSAHEIEALNEHVQLQLNVSIIDFFLKKNQPFLLY